MSRKILAVVAHADDETLGCGGTLARHANNGDDVMVITLTDGVSSRNVSHGNEQQRRNDAFTQAMHSLGVRETKQFHFPDNMLDSVPLLDIVKSIESVITSFKPAVVYTHFAHDLNIDHAITNKAVLTACRPQNSCSVTEIYAFEVLSSTEWISPGANNFSPQFFVDIETYWQKKIDALNCYTEEMRKFPHSRSLECVEALAILRGASNGMLKAEAFQVERIRLF